MSTSPGNSRYAVEIEEACRWRDLEDALAARVVETDSRLVAYACAVWQLLRWAVWDDAHRRVFLLRDEQLRHRWEAGLGAGTWTPANLWRVHARRGR